MLKGNRVELLVFTALLAVIVQLDLVEGIAKILTYDRPHTVFVNTVGGLYS